MRKLNVSNSRFTRDYILNVTATKLSGNYTTLGSPARILQGQSKYFQSLASTPSVINANEWISVAPIVSATLGQKVIVTKILVYADRDCTIGLSHNTGGNLTGTYNDYIRKIEATSGDTVTFDFSQNPLEVMYNSGGTENVQLYYARNATTGILYNVYVEGYSVTNCGNVDAPFEIGFIGDSFCKTHEFAALEYKNDNGTETGHWTIILQKFLKTNRISTYRSNIGQGGTNTGYWAMRCQNGLFRRYKPDILFLNVGINDGINDITSLNFEKNFKTIIENYFTEMPNGCMIVNNICDTDIASKLEIIPTGEHANKTFLAGARDALRNVVNLIKATNQGWDLVLAETIPSNTYTSSQQAYYIETSVGNRLHPNTTLGQPAIANVCKQSISNTQFFNRNKG